MKGEDLVQEMDFSKAHEIFEAFEACVRKYGDFISNYYDGGRRCFEVCCSVRDWLESALAHLAERFPSENAPLPKGLDIYLLVVVADIIQKGVEELFRKFSLDGMYKERTKTDFFVGRQEDCDDAHFGRLRAVFGAHPFDIGKNRKSNRGCVHFLGDSPTWHGRICAVVSKEGEDLEYWELFLPELKKYLSHRLGLLMLVYEKIEKDVQMFIELMRETPIKGVDSGDVIARVSCLCEEASASKRGCFSEGFDFELEKLHRYFSCKITDSANLPMVEAYRNALLSRIDYWAMTLQTMSFVEEDISDEPLLDVHHLGLPNRWLREFQEVVLKEKRLFVLRRIFSKYFPVGDIDDDEFELLIMAYLFTHPEWGKENTNL